MPIYHLKTVGVGDGTTPGNVEPSDWNSSHAYTLQEAVSLSGNTVGLPSLIQSSWYLFGGNNVTLSQNANSVTVSAGNTTVSDNLWPAQMPVPNGVSTFYSGSTSQGAGGNSTQTGYTFSHYIVPMVLQKNLSVTAVYLPLSAGSSTNRTGSVTQVFSVGIYSNNASTLSKIAEYYGGLFYSQNQTSAVTYSVWTASTGGNTAGGSGGFAGISAVSSQSGNSFTSVQGMKLMKFVGTGPTLNLTRGNYWLVVGFCSVSNTGQSNVFTCGGFLQSNAISNTCLLDWGANTSATLASLYGWGAISTTFTSQSSAATWFPLPASIAVSNMTSSVNSVLFSHFIVMRGI